MTDKPADDLEQQVVHRITEHLDARSADIDADTLSRLRQSREAALEELQIVPPRMFNSVAWRWSGGLVTASAFIFALYLVFVPQADEQPALGPLLVDSEILVETEELEFLADLEFYAWLEEQELAPSEA